MTPTMGRREESLLLMCVLVVEYAPGVSRLSLKGEYGDHVCLKEVTFKGEIVEDASDLSYMVGKSPK